MTQTGSPGIVPGQESVDRGVVLAGAADMLATAPVIQMLSGVDMRPDSQVRREREDQIRLLARDLGYIAGHRAVQEGGQKLASVVYYTHPARDEEQDALHCAVTVKGLPSANDLFMRLGRYGRYVEHGPVADRFATRSFVDRQALVNAYEAFPEGEFCEPVMLLAAVAATRHNNPVRYPLVVPRAIIFDPGTIAEPHPSSGRPDAWTVLSRDGDDSARRRYAIVDKIIEDAATHANRRLQS